MKLAWLTATPIAHRGWHGSGRGPENSLASFRAARDAGFAIECDVHPTADGDVAVFHDDTLDRMTDATGPTRDRTLAELRALSIGGDERIPSLAETLDLVGGRVALVIELKGFGRRQDGFVRAVAAQLSDYEGKAAIMSFDHSLVRGFGGDAPGVACGLTAEGSNDVAFDRHRAVASSVDFVSYDVGALPNPFVREFRSSGRPVITWTVRTSEQVRRTQAHADQMTFEGFDARRLGPPGPKGT